MLDKLTALSQKLGAGMGLLIGNLVWLLTDQILPMGLGLLVGVWVASYLGPTQFGLLNYAIGLVSLFASGATMGLDTLAVRDSDRDLAPRSRRPGSDSGECFYPTIGRGNHYFTAGGDSDGASESQGQFNSLVGGDRRSRNYVSIL